MRGEQRREVRGSQNVRQGELWKVGQVGIKARRRTNLEQRVHANCLPTRPGAAQVVREESMVRWLY
jgi:hypothetical protein